MSRCIGAASFLVAIVYFLLVTFSSTHAFVTVFYIIIGLYALFKLADRQSVLNWFRVIIVGYSLCCISFHPEFKVGISICTFIAFVSAPISENGNKITWDMLWQAISFGTIAGVAAVFTFFSNYSDRVEVWIFGHYVLIGVTYLICFLLTRKKIEKPVKITAKENLGNISEMTTYSSSLRIPLFVIIGILAMVTIIYHFATNSTKSIEVSRASTASKPIPKTSAQAQLEQTVRPEVKTPETTTNEVSFDWVKLLSSKGKYGSFSTYFDKKNILSDGKISYSFVADVYDKCTKNMPYCVKYKEMAFHCEEKFFVVWLEITEKGKDTISETHFTEETVKVKEVTESEIATKVFEEVCRPYIEKKKALQSRVTTQSKSEPQKNYYSAPTYTPCVTRCRDGSCSSSTRRGTCSYHGGVAR